MLGLLGFDVAPHGAHPPPEDSNVGAIIGVAIAVVVVGLIVWFILSVVRLAKRNLAARNARLLALAQRYRLAVKPQTDDRLFTAEGTTPSGVALRFSVERVIRHGADGAVEDFVFSIAARCRTPAPLLIAQDRRSPDRTHVAPMLHELSTGDPLFDQHFISWAEDDAAAKNLLARGARDMLLGLGQANARSSGQGLWVGVDSFKAGGEVALSTVIRFPTLFFAEGRIEGVVETVLRLASG